MIGTGRPLFVLFGSSIVQFSYGRDGWGTILADIYARKALQLLLLKLNHKAPNVQIHEESRGKIEEMWQVSSTSKLEYWSAERCQLAMQRAHADILLRGYAGWNSRRALEVLHQVFPKDAVVQPSLVIVYFGGNDSMEPHPSGLGPHVPLPEFVENMKKIALHLKGLSDKTRVMFLSAPPVNEEQIVQTIGVRGRSNEACRVYSEACIRLCKELDVKGIDLWTALQQRDDWKTACFTDGIHLSSEGSKLVAKEILKGLREAEWKPSLYWRSLPTEFGEESVYDPISQDGRSNISIAQLEFSRSVQWE